MGKIDTSEWKEFKLGYIMVGNKKQGHGLFEIVNSVAYHGKDVTETDSDDGINYITRSKFNNGLKARVVRLDKFKVNPAGTISFGAENADFFYQTEPYITGNKMYYIDTTALSERACRFLKSIMEATFTANYSFSDGMIPARIYDECIKLPATPDGAPDWAYMESYMANLETKVAESLTLLQAAKDAEKKKVDTREWGEFRVGELFKTQMKGKKNQVPTGANVPMQDMIKDGSTPRITVTGVNNGVFGLYDYCGKNSTEYRVFRNFISVSFLGTVFYQEGEATLDMKVHCLQPNHITLNKYTGNFLVSAIKASLRESSYSDQISSTILPEMTIMLPKDKTGQPDWAYMEEYMRKVEERVKVTMEKYEMTVNEVAL